MPWSGLWPTAAPANRRLTVGKPKRDRAKIKAARKGCTASLTPTPSIRPVRVRPSTARTRRRRWSLH